MKCWCGGGVNLVLGSSIDRAICSESEFHDPFADGRPVEIKWLYIAGPMSGMKQNNYPLFNKVEKQLQNAGYSVINPAAFGDRGSHYVDLLREDLRQMLNCHGVAVLDNWWESTGARNEVMVAGLLKMPVRTFQEWLYIQEKLG